MRVTPAGGAMPAAPMTSQPLFSIIIPAYGRPDLLAQAVRSVLDQTVADFESVVVDDASPVPLSPPADPRLRLVRRGRNGGPAAARNTGLAVARGRYVAFLDDDDLFAPDRLALALEGLAAAPLAVCWIRYLDAPAGTHRALDGNVSDTILEDLTPHLGTVAVQRSRVLPFDQRFTPLEDVEWWLRMAAGTRVRTVRRVGYLLRRHPGRFASAARIRGRLLLLRDHAAYFAARPRAAAFQWKRIGLQARELGYYPLARTAFRRALAIHPEAEVAWHLLRSLRPSGRGGGLDLLALPER